MLHGVGDQLAEHERDPVADPSGSPASIEMTERRAIAAAPVPPAIKKEAVFASVKGQ